MMENKVKYLIIGGGLSGLTFANYIQDDYLIVEKETEVGGYCRTIRKKDFVWDYAGHFFHSKTEEFKKLFIEKVGEKEIIYKNKNAKIFYHKYLVDDPFQINIHQLEKEEFAECLHDLFHREEKEEYDNFLDLLYGKFGVSIVEKFLKPYNEKLYAVGLQELDKDAMGRFFPYADIQEIVNHVKENRENTSYNHTFLYPKEGIGALIQALHGWLKQENIRLNSRVVEINREEKRAYMEDGTSVSYEYLVNTSPLNEFLTYFKEPSFMELHKKLSYNKVLVLNLGFNKKSTYKEEHWIYVPDQKINFYRMGFYDNILGTDQLSMYIEIGYTKEAEINVEKQLELTLENLRNMGVTDEETVLEAYSSVIMEPAYVHISTESSAQVKRFLQEMSDNGIYSIGRYGGWTYCSMEDCMAEAKELAERLEQLERGE